MGVNLTIVEGPPGPPPDVTKIVATLAWCPALAVASPNTDVVQIDSLSGLRGTIGNSIGSECVSRRYRISKSRGLLMSHLASVAGVISSVTQTGLGPEMTVAADNTHPLDDASVIVRVKKAGAPGAAEVEISHGFNVIQQGNVQRLYGAAQIMPARLSATVIGTKDLTTIVYAKPAIVTGTADVSDPTLYGSGGSLAGKTIEIAFDGGTSTTYTIPSGASAPADLDALAGLLNVAFGILADPGGAGYTTFPYLTLFGTAVGTTGEVDIISGTALSLLGLSVSTTNGTAGALDGRTIIYEADTGGSQTITFGTSTSAVANAAQLAAAVDAAANINAGTYSSQQYLKINSNTIGGSSTLAITGGTALSILGLVESISPAEGAESTITIEHLGITCTFPVGTYRAGTTYAFTTKTPMPSVAEVEDRLAELDAAGFDFGVVHIAAPFIASDALALANALDDLGAEWEARAGNPRAVHFVVGVDPNETDAVVKATFAGFRSRRVDIAARGAYVSSGLIAGGASLLRSQSWPAADADALIEFYQDRGERQLQALQNGFPEVRAITADENTASTKFVNPSGVRFNVMVADTPSRIHFKGGYSADDASSKFTDASVRNVTNRGFIVLYQALKRNENRTDLDTESDGKLTESSAGKVETSADPDLRAALVPNAATDVRVIVNRTNDYYTDREILGSAVIQNRVPARDITFSIGPGLIVEG